ncbi:MAG: hypothetical protein AAGI91_13940 [Bacteroidota bacterium]
MLSRLALLSALVLFCAGCGLFGVSERGAEPPAGGVCAGLRFEFATGASEADCAASAGGEWVAGSCYCHGEEGGN